MEKRNASHLKVLARTHGPGVDSATGHIWICSGSTLGLVFLSGAEVCGGGQRIAWSSRLRPTDHGGLFLGRRVAVSHDVEITVQGCIMSIGESTFIGPSTTIVARSGITIGRDVLIAERVSIRDQDHQIHGPTDMPISQSGFVCAPIVIGDGAWVGAGAVILKGVTIGKGAVVAANAVVNRDVADFEIVGGVPARRLGVRGNRSE